MGREDHLGFESRPQEGPQVAAVLHIVNGVRIRGTSVKQEEVRGEMLVHLKSRALEFALEEE